VLLLAVAMWFDWRTGVSAQPPGAKGRRTFFVLLMLLPYALAVGSNVSIGIMVGQGVVFWVLAGVLVEASPTSGAAPARLSIFLVASVSIVAFIMSVAYFPPFDGTVTTGRTEAAEVMGGTLYLEADTAETARDLRRLGRERGITAGTPVIDVSGVGPGYAMMLGGRFLGRAHLFSVWQGGATSAAHVLDQVSCTDLASAWVIYADNDPGVSSALTDRGLELGRDYEQAFAFTVARHNRSKDLRVLAPTDRTRSALGC
jgi:hypothetical protein